jgi:hypothetical protein
VTAEEIREIEPSIERRDTDEGSVSFSPDINIKKFYVLREIAAQLAEMNAKPNPIKKMMEGFIEKFTPFLQGMMPAPPLPAGTIIEANGHYGVVQGDGSVMEIPEETALKLIAEAKERKPQ